MANSNGPAEAYERCWPLSPTPSDAWHADSPINIANSANTFFMNFCLRMLSVVTTVSDFSLELQRAAYGYRADYYLGEVRGMRQVRKLRSRQVLALYLSRQSFPLAPFRHPPCCCPQARSEPSLFRTVL